MVFSSIVFLFYFLPIVLLLYFLSPRKIKNTILLLSSLFFYAWGEEYLVLLLIVSSALDYFCGIIISSGKRKLGLVVSLIFNLLILLVFKYLNFTFDNFKYLLSVFGIQSEVFHNIPQIALPIGISFYTFQTMSYTIDVYRGHVKASRNFIDFATYVCMFPQLVAGPIVRYADINFQLKNRENSIGNISKGIERFILGFAKKILIANTLGAIADDIFNQNINDLSTPFAWIGIISYTFQIYYDFSGYSDMAIGLGRMLGFTFLENFNYPYISKSIKEFWRRWHISLSSWFRDYLYIPLGGNRKGKVRTYINLFIVFFVTGLWHGATWNFVIWGLFHGLFLVMERVGFDRLLNRFWKPIKHIYTLLIVIIGWVIFRAEKMSDVLLYLKKMFWYSSGDKVLSSYLEFFHINFQTLFFLVIAIIFSCPVLRKIKEMNLLKKYPAIRIVVLFLIFILSITYMTTQTYNPFIYFRF